ncbi:DUF1320 domain-containing protein [Nitrosospira lacus]|uniref:DUF1320 domain-containing protein n=1 Tax=Nitrosospira lacus TaxID=1288494 RepID=A0A1W6SQU7_9PROT|nr:DUF1320 domain-containing protein [Nitrosospira lacus]ARO88177.1 DUF1320 domain-containing protein [Nitrosospira lacus]
MSYATKQDLVDRFGIEELTQLTDRSDTSAIDDTVVTRALEDADAEINGYLATKYTLPILPVPTVLEKLACDIARYRLYDVRATDQLTQRYKDTIRFLQEVATGKVSLGADATNEQPVQSGGAGYDAGDRVFTANRSDGTVGTLGDYL